MKWLLRTLHLRECKAAIAGEVKSSQALRMSGNGMGAGMLGGTSHSDWLRHHEGMQIQGWWFPPSRPGRLLKLDSEGHPQNSVRGVIPYLDSPFEHVWRTAGGRYSRAMLGWTNVSRAVRSKVIQPIKRKGGGTWRLITT